jgi:hypothetical protein
MHSFIYIIFERKESVSMARQDTIRALTLTLDGTNVERGRKLAVLERRRLNIDDARTNLEAARHQKAVSDEEQRQANGEYRALLNTCSSTLEEYARRAIDRQLPQLAMRQREAQQKAVAADGMLQRRTLELGSAETELRVAQREYDEACKECQSIAARLDEEQQSLRL